MKKRVLHVIGLIILFFILIPKPVGIEGGTSGHRSSFFCLGIKFSQSLSSGNPGIWQGSQVFCIGVPIPTFQKKLNNTITPEMMEGLERN